MYRIGRAPAREAAVAVDILREAALWSLCAGRPVWPPDSFDVVTFQIAANAGELVLGYERGEPVACMLLQTRDETYWPNDAAGEALYVHKVAVRRRAAGKGWVERFVHWARDDAERLGARYLRLDTLDRPKLLSLYADLGFRFVDSFAQHWCGDTIVLLELPLRQDAIHSTR